MDSKSQTILTIEPTSDIGKAKRKNSSVGRILKVVLFMLRRRHSKKSKTSADMDPDKGMWRRLLGSMRPLHIQANEPAPAATAGSDIPSKPKEDFEESLMPLPSSSPSPSSLSFSPTSRSSSFNTSHYASATSLHELDGNDDNNNESSIGDDGGDEMIDAKAEEFIAQFYEQIRRQRY